jgi:leader peptidase (prepilin peptidase) / N-methyltransferase
VQTNIFLFVFGAIIGMVVNWAIYQLCYFGVRPISPFSLPPVEARPRRWHDYLPIVGWLGRRGDSSVFGKWFWIRPLLIELGLAIFAVWFYRWQLGGGLLDEPRLAPVDGHAEWWYAAQFLLVTLLVAATFIDFDEQTIPDAITLPGTLAALAFAVLAPETRLPIVVHGPAYESLHFNSPNSLSDLNWLRDWKGLAIGLGIYWVWVWALLPKRCTLRHGVWRGLALMWVSIFRPQRKTQSKLRTQERQTQPQVWGLLLLGVLLSVIYGWIWYLGGKSFESLFGATLGMAFGGGVIWAVRIIARMAMGQEAMGFGDVTLMIMIGAFLGWQAILPIFFCAACTAVFAALANFLFTGENAFAFGPFLSIGAVATIIWWQPFWRYLTPMHRMNEILVGILIGALILLGVIMWGIQLVKGAFGSSRS